MGSDGSDNSTSTAENPKSVGVPTDKPHRFVVRRQTYLGRLRGLTFETNKCFLLPGAIPGLRRIREFYDEHPAGTVLVVGHTDRVGRGNHNVTLSENRAAAVAAFLQDDVDPWLAWYQSDKPAGERWGTREDQHMLSVLPDPADSFYGGRVSGTKTQATEASVRRFQKWSTDRGTSLAEDGIAGPNTRRALVRFYMEQDGTTLPSDVTILEHGCGEFHPAQPTKDGVDCPANRRVEVFLFGGPYPPPAPCRSPGCQEYDQWVAAVNEEINADGPAPVCLEGRITYPDDTPAASVPFVVEVDGQVTHGGYTDADGRYGVSGVDGDAQLRLCDAFSMDPQPEGAGQVRVAVSGGGGLDGEYHDTA